MGRTIGQVDGFIAGAVDAARGIILAIGDDKHGGRTGKSDKKRPAVPEVGSALRSAYQRTIDEDIPPEMLDLLGKLG